MAIPNNYIDKITNKDTGESRIISPAADKVRVDNENFEGADLDEVLDEVAQAIEDAGSGDGTVTGVKMNNGQPISPDENGVVDLGTVITDVSNKVDKVTGYGLSKNDYSDADKTKLAGIEPGAEVNVINGIKANGASTTLPVDQNGVVELPPAGSTISPATAVPLEDGTAGVGSSAKYAREDHVHPHDTSKQDVINDLAAIRSGATSGATALQQSDVSVETQGDGTVDINVGEDTYTINLNHTHEDMAKIVKCTEATLPQTLENDTIYVQVDNVTTPSEIESLWLFGLEFTGGGGVPGTPRLISPSQTIINNGIDIGNTTSGTVSYPVNIKAKDLTQSLIVELSNSSTGYSFDTSDLPTGVSYDSGTGKLTITKEAATAINGVDIPVVYTGSDSDENAEGTLGISSSSVDGIDVEVTLIANKVTIVNLAGVKLTGTQWGQTDYNVNVNTKVSMRLKFTENANTIAGDNTNKNYYFLTCYTLSSSSKQFAFYAYKSSSTEAQLLAIVPATPTISMHVPNSSMVVDESLFEVGLQSMKFTPNGGTAITISIGATPTMDRGPLTIGLYHSSSGTDSIFNWYDLTIYELTITENNVVKRHYTPVAKNGVPGLLDSETGHFMSSETAKTSGLASDEFVAIPLT